MAASGANLKLTEAFNLEVLSTSFDSAMVKCNHAGDISGLRRLYESIGGIDPNPLLMGSELHLDVPTLGSGVSPQQPQSKNDSFNEILLTRFVHLLQKFVNIAEKGGEVDKSPFCETCSQTTALLLSNLCVYLDMLVSAAPPLGSLVPAELVDAWLWTNDTKRGLFASEVRYSGPAKLRSHLAPGEPEALPKKDPVEQIMAFGITWELTLFKVGEAVHQPRQQQSLIIIEGIKINVNYKNEGRDHPIENKLGGQEFAERFEHIFSNLEGKL
ncbi:unnamed protein product [Ilex paraguariensis]|uniref:PI4-kinase N-terminal domain-containing protein n=1 Tax=Ilex paraguariensis TaxID=185542 RepID=A0ABC8REK4_9AQUA